MVSYEYEGQVSTPNTAQQSALPYVRVFSCRRASIAVVPQAKQSTAHHSTAQHSTAQRSAAQHSTAQHSTPQSALTSNQSRTCRSERDDAIRQSWREQACSQASTTRCVFKTNGDIEICSVHNKIQPLKKQPSWCDARDLSLFPISVRYNTAPLFISYYTSMPRPGCFPGARSSWHLQVVSLHLNELRIIFCVLSCGRA